MTDLTKQLEQALCRRVVEFGNVNNDAHIEGINFHADRLAPLHAALLKCVEALECSVKRYEASTARNPYSKLLMKGMTHWTYDSLSFALADLRKALEECK